MKPGAFGASTEVLPQAFDSACIAATSAGSVSTPAMTSTSFMRVAGLKKCQPITRCGRARPCAIAVIEIDEVLVASTASAPSTPSSSRNSARFGVELLDDRLDREAAAGERGDTPSAMERRATPRRARPRRCRPRSHGAREVGADALQRALRRHPAGVSKSRTGWPALRRELRDARAHAAGADHRDRRAALETVGRSSVA